MASLGSYGLVLLTVLAGVAACAPGVGDEEADDSADVTSTSAEWAENDWSAREDWYKNAQGSQLVDYEVFRAIERADSEEAFASRANIERYGFEYPPAGSESLTTDGLALGMHKDTNREEKRDYLGMSCPACHTGALDIEGKRILVEGGQSFVDVPSFVKDLSAAVDATLESSEKKARACAELGDDCVDRLKEEQKRLHANLDRNPIALANGPGRADAITQILNEVFSNQVSNQPAMAHSVPVSIPAVWDAPRLRCVQTNCLSSNPIGRNIGEVLGVYGHSQMKKVDGKIVVTGTPKVEELHALEHSLESLPSPKWNEPLMGALDKAKVRAGEKVFEKTCSGCHAEPYKANAGSDAFEIEENDGTTNKLWRVTTRDYAEVGTDPAFVEVHGARWVNDDAFSDFFEQSLRSKVAAKLGKNPDKMTDRVVIEGASQLMKLKLMKQGLLKMDGSVKAIIALGAVVVGVENSTIAAMTRDANAAKELKAEYEWNRAQPTDVNLAVYRARPLNGIAFTAPYGHNGAWPTLRELLKKPADRMVSYHVRPRSFDAKNVGLVTTPERRNEDLFYFDGTKKGNLNGGHVWGTDLSAEEKSAVIEYLKSI